MPDTVGCWYDFTAVKSRYMDQCIHSGMQIYRALHKIKNKSDLTE